jgi:hypothetical protein
MSFIASELRHVEHTVAADGVISIPDHGQTGSIPEFAPFMP